jgi:transposase
LALPNVLSTRVGRLIAQHFADPHRLARLGASRFIGFAAARGLRVRRPLADRLIAAARDALPSRDAAVAGQILAADLSLLTSLDEQVHAAEATMAQLVPETCSHPC